MTRALLAAAAVLLVVAGCGGGDEGGSGGYLARAENGAAYLHWTRDGGQATGSLTLARLVATDGGRYELDADEAPFSALVDGDDVTLTFEQGLGLTTRWSGRIDGETITLRYQSEGGGLQELRFKRAELEAYNEAVSALQGTIADADVAASDAEATQAAVARIDTAAEAAWARIQTLQGYPAELERLAGEVAAELPGVRDALEQSEQALAETRAADSFNVCYEADSTAYEADAVDYEVDQVRYAIDNLTSSITTMNEEIAALETAMAELDTAASSLPDYHPETAPVPADLEAAIGNARESAAEARGRAKATLREATGLAAKADEYAAAANAECDKRGQ